MQINHHLAVAVSQVPEPLLDAFKRLLDLLARPDDIPSLDQLIQKEKFFIGS